MKIETVINLNKFKPRSYQAPIWDAIENKGYKRVLAILPRRAGKDVTAFNLCIRECLRKVCVIYYIFPTYSQAKKVIWDSITNTGTRILDYIPDELVESKNSQEMKIRFVNGSLLQLVGSDNFDCYDDQTEVLTEDGWKLFRDLNKKEKIATLDPLTSELKYQIPEGYLERDYNGDLYAVSNSSMDFRVTPTHKFWVKSPKGEYKFKKISDDTIRYDSIPSQCKWYGNRPGSFILGYRSMDFMSLAGIYFSSGNVFCNEKCYGVTISQIKCEIKRKIRELLYRMNIKFEEHGSGFNIDNRILYDYFSQFGLGNTRFIPKDIKMLDRQYLQVLFDWLILSNNYSSKNNTVYYSISRVLSDDVQEIIIKLGLSGNVSVVPQKKSIINKKNTIPKHVVYQVNVINSKFKRFHASIKKPYIYKVPYKGKIYCVYIPSLYLDDELDKTIIKVRRNGKEYWSGNSLMGTNPQGVVFSEYSLQDPRAYQYIRPILTANNGWSLFLSTPRGKNHLWELYQIAQQSPTWFCYKLTVEDTNHIPLQEIERERADGVMSEDLIQQEYYTSFTMGVEGAYYAKYIDRMRVKGQIGMVPYEVGFKVHTSWDLGVRDSTTIIFFQVIGQTVRIIDCYENSKQGLEHYISIINQKPYVYGKHIAPHDIKVREFTSGLSRIEKAKQLGITFTVAPDLSIEDGIEAVRTTLSKIWIDDRSCTALLKALENYRQEYDIKRKVYKNHPLHDWSSHWADNMRYLAISLPKTRDGLSAEQLEKRYQEAVYGSNSNMPAVFRDDLPQY